jgi:hypothetical protein
MKANGRADSYRLRSFRLPYSQIFWEWSGGAVVSAGGTLFTWNYVPPADVDVPIQPSTATQGFDFLLPFCYFAYRRSLWGIVLTLLTLATSMFWFPLRSMRARP